jgi:hypothetical protein
MLNGEAFLAFVCVAAGLFALKRINVRQISVSQAAVVLP